MIKREYHILALITLVGGLLRFYDLGLNPLWIDEGLFAHLCRDSMFTQEYIPVWIVNILGLYNDEFHLRFIFALAGTLTIPAIYYVVKRYKLQAALFTAIFPFFIFWSRQARPYALCGLFMVLGWKWWQYNIIAIVTSPISFIGTRLRRSWKITGFLLLIAVIVYFNRPEVSNAMSGEGWTYGNRFLYLPLLALVLNITEYDLKYKFVKPAFIILILLSLTQLPATEGRKWYSSEVPESRYTEGYRTAGDFDFALGNAHVSNFYNSKHNTWEYKGKFYGLIKQRLLRGDTLTLALDYMTLETPDFPDDLKNRYRNAILDGRIIRLGITKDKIWEY